MKYLLILFLGSAAITQAQTADSILQSAKKFERALKDEPALSAYSELNKLDKNNLEYLIKCSQFSMFLGDRQKEENTKRAYYEQSKNYSLRAFAKDSLNTWANYWLAYYYAKESELEKNLGKKTALFISELRHINQILSIDSNFARAYYLKGKMQADILNLNWLKKTTSVLFLGAPKANIESAIENLEQCKRLDPLFILNYLNLAKLYELNNKPAKVIEVLTAMQKLPFRTSSDVELKAEGRLMAEKYK